jgi:hypothetical protein
MMAALCAALLGSVMQSAAAADQCNRACLHKTLDAYLAAVFKHDPKAAPLAKDTRATENAVEFATGEGIWRTATGYGAVQRRYFDPANDTAIYYGIINEGDQSDIVSVRIKVAKRRITEAEWTVARKGAGGLFSVDGLLAQPPPPDTALPKSERTPRAQMIAAAEAYFHGIEAHDGANVPHVPGCDRIENGIKVTNRSLATPLGGIPGGAPAPAPAPNPSTPGLAQETPAGATPGMAQEARSGDCAAGFQMFQRSIAQASHRRHLVVDEDNGVVVEATIFHRPPTATQKRNLLTEYFWVRGGKISAIYAAMYYLDPSAPDTPGW